MLAVSVAVASGQSLIRCSLRCELTKRTVHAHSPEERSVYDVFWWCSALARTDTRDTQMDLPERYPSGGRTAIRSMLPPEEVTTFNFARRLAVKHKQRGGKGVVALHSKALEGGSSGKRPPSGADIELAVEITPGNWIDLLLQAKRIYEPRVGRNGFYEGWKADQIKTLRRWAANNGNRTPGMLLYNSEVILPFVRPGRYVALGGCCMSPIQCHRYSRPIRSSPPDRRSPVGITLVILPRYRAKLPSSLAGDSLSAVVVNQYASPLECIFCPARLTGAGKSFGGKTGRPISVISPKNRIPQWAAILLAAVSEYADEYSHVDTALEASSPGGHYRDDNHWDAQYSVVLPYIEGAISNEG
jgi:hypothetical protein